MYMKQQFHPLLLVQSNIIKNKTHTAFIIHMTNVDCIKIGDPKILFMVVALVNQNYWKISKRWHEIPFSTSRFDINQTSNQPTNKSSAYKHLIPKKDQNVGINKVFLCDEIDEQKWEIEFQ